MPGCSLCDPQEQAKVKEDGPTGKPAVFTELKMQRVGSVGKKARICQTDYQRQANCTEEMERGKELQTQREIQRHSVSGNV